MPGGELPVARLFASGDAVGVVAVMPHAAAVTVARLPRFLK